jgi:hypothetical protein
VLMSPTGAAWRLPVVVDLRLVLEPETVSSYPLASGRMERRFQECRTRR